MKNIFLIILIFINVLFIVSCDQEIFVDQDLEIKLNTKYKCGYKNMLLGFTKKSIYILREEYHTLNSDNMCELNKFNSKGKEVHFKKQQHKTDSYHCRVFFIKRFTEDKCVEVKLKVEKKQNIKARNL